jgi:hypothetical protein
MEIDESNNSKLDNLISNELTEKLQTEIYRVFTLMRIVEKHKWRTCRARARPARQAIHDAMDVLDSGNCSMMQKTINVLAEITSI